MGDRSKHGVYRGQNGGPNWVHGQNASHHLPNTTCTINAIPFPRSKRRVLAEDASGEARHLSSFVFRLSSVGMCWIRYRYPSSTEVFPAFRLSLFAPFPAIQYTHNPRIFWSFSGVFRVPTSNKDVPSCEVPQHDKQRGRPQIPPTKPAEGIQTADQNQRQCSPSLRANRLG